PRCSVLAASSALASSGSASFRGVAQPWRTSQVDRSCPTTLHRAAKSLASPPGGSVQLTARERMKRVSAARALAPQGQEAPFILPLAGLVSLACVDALEPDHHRIGGKEPGRVPASRTLTLK